MKMSSQSRRKAPSVPEVSAEIVPFAKRKSSFEVICGEIRQRVDNLETHFAQETLVVADLLMAAKRQYEEETGTGHGKGKGSGVTPFKEAMAKNIGRSPSFVQRLLTISHIDPSTRGLLEEHGVESQAQLLRLAREPGVEKRAEAVKAHAHGGVREFEKVLKRPPAEPEQVPNDEPHAECKAADEDALLRASETIVESIQSASNQRLLPLYWILQQEVDRRLAGLGAEDLSELVFYANGADLEAGGEIGVLLDGAIKAEDTDLDALVEAVRAAKARSGVED